MNDELKNLLTEFMSSFELVFDNDWEFSQGCLRDDWQQHFIVPGGTFLNPGVNDESNNWANRGHLLDVHRRLVGEMKKAGIYRAEL
jgi:hypothetical protein